MVMDLDTDVRKIPLENIRNHINNSFDNIYGAKGYHKLMINGIQEENIILREEGKSFYKDNILIIFKDILGFELLDPDDFYRQSFQYYCAYLYKNQKKIPFCNDIEFNKYSVPLFETCHEVYDQEFLSKEYMTKKQIIEKELEFVKIFQTKYLSNKSILQSKDEISKIENIVNEKFKKQQEIIDYVFSENNIIFDNDDAFATVSYSFENDKLNLYYGETLLTFRVDFPNFYLNDDLVNIKDIVKEYNKNYTHFKYVREMINKEFANANLEKVFIRRANLNQIHVYYKSVCIPYLYENNNILRLDNSLIIPQAIVIEVIEHSRRTEKQKNKAIETAKKLFLSVLDEKQLKEMKNKKIIYIEGIDYNYFIIPEMIHHNLIQIPKGTFNLSEAKVLCIISSDYDVPRFDVLSTIAVLIKSGNEKIVNKTANFFKPNNEHISYLKKYFQIKTLKTG